MPVGVIINVLAVAVGGFLGAKGSRLISAELKEKLTHIFGLCAMGIGVTSVILMRNMPAVILAVIVGTAVGILLHLTQRIERGAVRLARLIPSQGSDTDQALLVTAVVLFCASGTGIYGSIISCISGDHSILIAKSILDLPTSMIFACTLGAVVSAIALPQFIIFLALFLGAKLSSRPCRRQTTNQSSRPR